MNKTRDFGLTPLDELFETDESLTEKRLEKIVHLNTEDLEPFCNHPFQVRDDAEMAKLSESVKKFGVINPVIVRPKLNGRYELISGHRRKRACELAGLCKIPVIIRDMTDDQAILFMVDSNMQRENLLPSEKAWAYKMKMEALKRQNNLKDQSASQVGTHLRSDEILAQQVGESRNQVQRYIHLTELIPELMRMVDEKKIGIGPAYELSFLEPEEQKYVLDNIMSENATPSLAQAKNFKMLSQQNRLDEDEVYSVLRQEKPNQREQIKISRDELRKYFPADFTPQKIKDCIFRALDLYRKRQRDMER